VHPFSFFKSRPGKYLLGTTIFIGIITLCIPWTPFAAPFGFKPLPFPVILMIAAIIGLYILTAETIKRIFYKRVRF
jgi:Mg2+-importing ATPase